VENARGKEEHAHINRVPAGQPFSNVHDKASLIHPHLCRVVDLWRSVDLAIHTQRVTTSGSGEQASQNRSGDHVVGHRNDKGFILDKGLAGENRGGIPPPIILVGQTLGSDAVPAPVAQITPYQMTLVPYHYAQAGKASPNKGLDGIVDQRPSQHRHQRFGTRSRQGSQPLAGSCSKNHTFHPPPSFQVPIRQKPGSRPGFLFQQSIFTQGAASSPLCRRSSLTVACSTSPLCGPVFHGYEVS
jgi:hypothetical protein